MTDSLDNVEIRYHSAMPMWCKMVGLEIKAIPLSEGGGFMIRRDQAERIMELLGNHKAADQ